MNYAVILHNQSGRN